MPPKKRLTPEIDTGQITPRCACSVPPLRPAPAGLFQPPFESTHHGAPPGAAAVCLGAAECR
ncbi:hypothetical protein IPC1286_15020 [Pseudomonas aeruginosa]|nr:hypothetical protein IPC1286_15020 [Pseudomonas aeruginosa]